MADLFGMLGSIDRSAFQQVHTKPQCARCQLCNTAKSPFLPPTGNGKSRILVLVDGPSAYDDDVGAYGEDRRYNTLAGIFGALGCSLREDCWYMGATVCNRGRTTIDQDTVRYCKPYVHDWIRNLDPTVIITFGDLATRSVHAWRAMGNVANWVGYQIPDQTLNVWICPVYSVEEVAQDINASGVHRTPALPVVWSRHIAEAIAVHSGVPWGGGVPNFRDFIRCELDTVVAAKIIETQRPKRIAFDYECNGLDPYAPSARIYTCSICFDGKRTLAFPWDEYTRSATVALLENDQVLKMGANIKFEDNWSVIVAGATEVRSWAHCTQASAHIMDTRKGIVNVEFQAYVHVGQSPWSDGISPYLTTTNYAGINRIDACPLPELLMYNGLDSHMEYLIARSQCKASKLGYRF